MFGMWWCANSQNPSWYSSLKSISILSSHIHIDLLNSLFPTCFPIKNLFNITFIPMHSTFLTHLPLFFDTPVSDKLYKLWKSTLHIIFFHFPLSLFQTLFSSLCSQTKPAYKWQKALPISKSPFLCYSYHASIFHPTKLKSNKTEHKPHFTLHINYYMFQH